MRVSEASLHDLMRRELGRRTRHEAAIQKVFRKGSLPAQRESPTSSGRGLDRIGHGADSRLVPDEQIADKIIRGENRFRQAEQAIAIA